jgi:DNA-binding NarL/FixJ family response regulator
MPAGDAGAYVAGVKVLVIDDTPRVRKRFVAMLSAVPGVETILEAGSAAAALEALRAHDPEVIVLDLPLSDGSGLAFAHCVKRVRPEAVLVIVTNRSTVQHRRWCLAQGADAFLDKSRDFDAVAGIVSDAVARRRAKRP